MDPSARVKRTVLGRYTQIAEGEVLLDNSLGDYSYAMRFCNIANATIGQFASIASFVRIGATDHPIDRASQHHFLYCSADNWRDAESDAGFLDRHAARRAEIGHEGWLGHGAVLAANAVAPRDVRRAVLHHRRGCPRPGAAPAPAGGGGGAADRAGLVGQEP